LAGYIGTTCSPTETLVEFDFGCKFMFVTGKLEFYAAAIILLINANEGRRFGFAMLELQAGMLQVVVVVFMTKVIT
jgi:hypothetical protein